MSKTFFVTGTDTEVGKTAVSCALLHAAAETGLRTAAVKPVAAGCDGNGQNEDALQLMQAMTEKLDYSQVNPVALAPTTSMPPRASSRNTSAAPTSSWTLNIMRWILMAKAGFHLRPHY